MAHWCNSPFETFHISRFSSFWVLLRNISLSIDRFFNLIIHKIKTKKNKKQKLTLKQTIDFLFFAAIFVFVVVAIQNYILFPIESTSFYVFVFFFLFCRSAHYFYVNFPFVMLRNDNWKWHALLLPELYNTHAYLLDVWPTLSIYFIIFWSVSSACHTYCV